jgi:hypothetical protein
MLTQPRPLIGPMTIAVDGGRRQSAETVTPKVSQRKFNGGVNRALECLKGSEHDA